MTDNTHGASRAPGWHPDPQVPSQMRWWDGSTWTGDVYERVEPPGGFLDEPAAPVAAHHPPHVGQATTTDDGMPLGAWGRRVMARSVDSLITMTVSLLLSMPLVLDLAEHLSVVMQEQQRSPRPNPFVIYDPQTLRDLSIIGLVWLVVSLGYELGFLLWKAATPGKLLLGLRVRRWQAGEALTASVIARRWIGLQGLGQVLGALYTVLDGLWPLWDARRQALHDKLAGTCVVTAPADRPS